MDGQLIKNLQITKVLGQGQTCIVKLAQNKQTQQNYAIKIYHKLTNNVEKSQEIFALKTLQNKNPHIINLLDFDEKSILLEYMQFGELFDFVSKQRFPEKYAKFFFFKIASTLKFIHDNNFVHRDIKLENILFDQNLDLKIADFGFSAKIKDTDAKFDKYMGTQGYMAPEIEKKTPYQGQKVDIFASGVLLFCIVVGIPPFFKATENDPYYKFFYQKKISEYWDMIQQKYKIQVSEDFKNLFNKMVCVDPENRISIENILEHEWFENQAFCEENEAKIFLKSLIF
ncbi:protein kinase domain protein [Ichthyophthirius multifiliis]|uniref:Protein kinase domain protein n=1 Tax=Ichthyophthirius multifiliis TaxID=5932 RepID=G0QVA3_ICHMU|nr:protein kinase domain protein [Ichthyophthirius multifiliis]EGR30847.1 protein kinase domain protein [Ichthyophthirius multifiliis]|eukprot:XP_004032434.1 protein kinase domain protein [Ichthyophthirius multifiliis]